ncbi:MAG: type VI secretion system protein TssA [Acidobacteria bacterium]|nr:MAG: type VI secretion system protein TssA [Acidobacteriota bacterium]
MQAATHNKDYAALCLSAEGGTALLAPLAGAQRTGEPLRYSDVYDRIGEARREDDDRLAQGVWQKDLKRADWTAVAQLCGEALEYQSKDLQIAAWLAEAWGRLHGFGGVSAGLSLVAGLCNEYWPDLYPPLEDPEYRIAPFHWLNEKLSVSIQFIPLTQPAESQTAGYTWLDWTGAKRAEQEHQQHKEVPAPEPAPGAIEQALRRTAPERIAATRAGVAQAAATALNLESFLDGHLAAAHPSLRQLRTCLSEIGQWLEDTAAGITVVATATEGKGIREEGIAAMGTGGDESGALGAPAVVPGGGIRNREEAYRLLGEAAAYLMKTEPHSPAPYLVLRAIRWGNMPLHELLPEMIRNQGALDDLQKLLNLET